MKSAILFGASGFIGSFLVKRLLESTDYSNVTIVVRKPVLLSHPKLKQLIADLDTLVNIKPDLKADDVFIAIGTTKAKTPNQMDYYKIDHDYPLMAAKALKDSGAKTICLVSAVGADPNSFFFYSKTKGNTEKDILSLDYNHSLIFRPSLLFGNRLENRPVERFFQKVWKTLDFLMIGGASRYRGIHGDSVAHSMVQAARSPKEKIKIYHWKEMI